MNALDAMKRALEEYPGRNPQQLQARKVCEGVLALAATLTQQQGGEQEAGDALDHLIDSLEAVVIDWAAGADKPQPERDRSLEISLGRLIPRLRRAASILMGSKP